MLSRDNKCIDSSSYKFIIYVSLLLQTCNDACLKLLSFVFPLCNAWKLDDASVAFCFWDLSSKSLREFFFFTFREKKLHRADVKNTGAF